MKSDKKICVIGGGNWGKNHISTLDKLGYLGGIVDSSELLINSYKSFYPNCEFYINIEDSFNSSFDGYIIATPPATHYKIAKK